MLRCHLQLRSTCQLRLYYQEGRKPALTAVGSSIKLVKVRASNVKGKRKERRKPVCINGYIYPVTRLARFARFANAHLVYCATPTARYINGRSNAYGDYLPLLPKPFSNLPGAGNQSLATCEIW